MSSIVHSHAQTLIHGSDDEPRVFGAKMKEGGCAFVVLFGDCWWSSGLESADRALRRSARAALYRVAVGRAHAIVACAKEAAAAAKRRSSPEQARCWLGGCSGRRVCESMSVGL